MQYLFKLFSKNAVSRALKKALLAVLSRVSWPIVAERLVARVVKSGLRWLAARTKSTIDDEIVEEIIRQIEAKDSKEVK